MPARDPIVPPRQGPQLEQPNTPRRPHPSLVCRTQSTAPTQGGTGEVRQGGGSIEGGSAIVENRGAGRADSRSQQTDERSRARNPKATLARTSAKSWAWEPPQLPSQSNPPHPYARGNPEVQMAQVARLGRATAKDTWDTVRGRFLPAQGEGESERVHRVTMLPRSD